MIRKSNEYRAERRPIAGSQMDFDYKHFFEKDELFGLSRLCAEITLQPGDQIPPHMHEKEAEIFYVTEGEFISIDKDGAETPFCKGDYMLTSGPGDMHSLRNDSGKPATVLAIMLTPKTDGK